jgi:hypothetical protein
MEGYVGLGDEERACPGHGQFVESARAVVYKRDCYLAAGTGGSSSATATSDPLSPSRTASSSSPTMSCAMAKSYQELGGDYFDQMTTAPHALKGDVGEAADLRHL